MHEYAPLRLLGYGETSETSWASFLGDFAARWDLIAREKDSKLTEDARGFKRKLLTLVESVQRAR